MCAIGTADDAGAPLRGGKEAALRGEAGATGTAEVGGPGRRPGKGGGAEW